jgi:hypothetical protein
VYAGQYPEETNKGWYPKLEGHVKPTHVEIGASYACYVEGITLGAVKIFGRNKRAVARPVSGEEKHRMILHELIDGELQVFLQRDTEDDVFLPKVIGIISGYGPFQHEFDEWVILIRLVLTE